MVTHRGTFGRGPARQFGPESHYGCETFAQMDWIQMVLVCQWLQLLTTAMIMDHVTIIHWFRVAWATAGKGDRSATDPLKMRLMRQLG